MVNHIKSLLTTLTTRSLERIIEYIDTLYVDNMYVFCMRDIERDLYLIGRSFSLALTLCVELQNRDNLSLKL
jgi:hypothetical protein